MIRAAFILLISALPGLAGPALDERTVTYPVTGTTAAELQHEMSAEGPRGFWAYTTWRVRWTKSCRVTLSVRYALPSHQRPEAMPAPLRARWDAMLVALQKHERGHAALGAEAARAVEAAGCRNTDPIFAGIARRERAYDRETAHGTRDGVTLAP